MTKKFKLLNNWTREADGSWTFTNPKLSQVQYTASLGINPNLGVNPKDLIGSSKPPLSLIPGTALTHLAMAMKNGADKYGAYNWRDYKIQSMIYCDAMERHLRAWIDGEDLAEDSGLHHLAHAMACA